MYYALYNKDTQKHLTHPQIGLWFTPDRTEADDMLVAAKEYVVAIGCPHLVEQLAVVEMDDQPN